jgi:hypothetical protein
MIARTNNKLILGKFELGPGDGEVRFHVAHLLTPDTLEDEAIARISGITPQMLDRHMHPFLSAI